jgi:ubiquilin
MKITFRLSSGGKFELDFAPSITILELKELIEKEQNIPANQQRLIYKGRILKDPQTVESYGKL